MARTSINTPTMPMRGSNGYSRPHSLRPIREDPPTARPGTRAGPCLAFFGRDFHELYAQGFSCRSRFIVGIGRPWVQRQRPNGEHGSHEPRSVDVSAIVTLNRSRAPPPAAPLLSARQQPRCLPRSFPRTTKPETAVFMASIPAWRHRANSGEPRATGECGCLSIKVG